MKYLKKYNENKKSKFDIDFAITKIKEKFSESDVNKMFNDEVLECTDKNWKDSHKSEQDWYAENNNGEAQDMVIDHILNWYIDQYNEISESDYLLLFDKIKDEFKCLNYV